jgi:hypothetical protein
MFLLKKEKNQWLEVKYRLPLGAAQFPLVAE